MRGGQHRCCRWSSSVASILAPRTRLRGFRTATRRHGLTADIVPEDHTEDSGVRAARDIHNGNDPITAVLASNDRCAVGVLDRAGPW